MSSLLFAVDKRIRWNQENAHVRLCCIWRFLSRCIARKRYSGECAENEGEFFLVFPELMVGVTSVPYQFKVCLYMYLQFFCWQSIQACSENLQLYVRSITHQCDPLDCSSCSRQQSQARYWQVPPNYCVPYAVCAAHKRRRVSASHTANRECDQSPSTSSGNESWIACCYIWSALWNERRAK